MLILGYFVNDPGAKIYNSINSWPPRSVQQVRALIPCAPLFCLELFTRRPINILQTASWDVKPSSIHFIFFFQNGGWKQEGQHTTKQKAEPTATFEHLKYTFCFIFVWA